MKIAVDKGHCLKGYDTSADGKNYGGFNESQYDRILGDLVIKMLREAGHDVIDVTVDDGTKYSNMYGSLADRVAAANRYGVDLYISIHFNASASLDAVGTETWIAPRSYYSSDSSYNANYEYAKRVNDNLVSLGFANRGVKEDAFYVLANSNAHAILIETCFCTGSSDRKIYDSLGAEKVANAIVSGVLNKAISTTSKTERVLTECSAKWIPSEVEKYLSDLNNSEIKLSKMRGGIYNAYLTKGERETDYSDARGLYDVYVCGKKVLTSCLAKWIPAKVDKYLSENQDEIKIVKVKEEYDQLFDVCVGGNRILTSCSAKWIPAKVESYLNEYVGEIKIIKVR